MFIYIQDTRISLFDWHSFLQSGSNGEEEKQYKRVAMVEDFFDIIYNVHVEMDGRGGKHAGQKRTYRAVSTIKNYSRIMLFKGNLCTTCYQ